MDIRDYLKLLRRFWIVIVVIVVLGAAASYFFSRKQPPTYTASNTLTITKTNALKQSEVNFYLFDNYYENQEANIISQTLVGWFSSSSFVQEIYQKAGVDSAHLSMRELSSAFTAVRTDPATITLSINGKDENQVSNLINAAPDVLQTEANNFSKNNNSTYKVFRLNPVIVENKPSLLLNTLIGFAGGVILSLLVIFGIIYFKKEKI